MNVFKKSLLQGIAILMCLSFTSYTKALDVTVSDVSEIQSAINQVSLAGGGTVHLVAGTYVISESIQMKSNVTFQGDGKTTIIELPADATYPMIIDDGTEPCVNMTVRNMLLDGKIPESKVSHDPDYTDDPQNPCLGILFDAGNEATYHTNVIIENVEIRNTVDACHIKGVKGGYMDNVYFHHNGIFYWPGHNAYLRRVIDFTVKNSRFEDSYNGSGVNCSWSTNLLFSNCVVLRSQGRGIRNAASDGFVVHDCVIIDCGEAGIIANTEGGIATSNVDFKRNCVSGCATGITGGTSGIASDNNSFNNGTNYSLGSLVTQSGNTSDASQSCSEGVVDFNQLELTASILNDNANQVLLIMSDNIADNNSIEGFTVAVNSSQVSIDNVVLENGNEIVITLDDDIVNTDIVTLSYAESGNVQSESGLALMAIEDGEVQNLLTGSAPILTSIETSKDGTQLHLFFNKKMQLPSASSELILTADYMGEKTISCSDVAFYSSESLGLSYTLSESVYYDYSLNLSYSGTSIVSEDNGVLAAFSEQAVTNTSSGLPLEITSASIDEGGLFASVKFNNELGTIHDQSDNFIFSINGVETTTQVTIASESTLLIYPSSKVYLNDEVTLSYTPNEFVKVISTNNAELAEFDDLSLENLSTLTVAVIPGLIEAEDYDSQSGIQLETCGEGGYNLAYIDEGDWTEYNVEVLKDTTYTLSIRVASSNSVGEITVFVDGNQKGIVEVPVTNGWQTYVSSTVDMKLSSGLHTVKMVFSGGFNVNWLKFEETEPGNEADSSYKIEAEDFDDNSGTSVEDCSDVDGGQQVGSITNGNWLMFSNVDLNDARSIDMRLATTKTGGSIEVRLGSTTGTLLATVNVPNTGGWQTWETVNTDIQSTEGIHDIYLVFKISGSWVCNINWFTLNYSTSNTSTALPEPEVNNISVYPNPMTSSLTIANANNSTISIYNIEGASVISDKIQSDKQSIVTSHLDSGLYFARIISSTGQITNIKVIKE